MVNVGDCAAFACIYVDPFVLQVFICAALHVWFWKMRCGLFCLCFCDSACSSLVPLAAWRRTVRGTQWMKRRCHTHPSSVAYRNCWCLSWIIHYLYYSLDLIANSVTESWHCSNFSYSQCWSDVLKKIIALDCILSLMLCTVNITV